MFQTATTCSKILTSFFIEYGPTTFSFFVIGSVTHNSCSLHDLYIDRVIILNICHIRISIQIPSPYFIWLLMCVFNFQSSYYSFFNRLFLHYSICSLFHFSIVSPLCFIFPIAVIVSMIATYHSDKNVKLFQIPFSGIQKKPKKKKQYFE